jgi:molecular chaperone HtpG
MEYPFRLKGVLYFPKLKNDLEYIDGQVKLYSNQVFIADNLKEVIPEFMLLLKGLIDCPDLPLNVSRSFLQNDGYVTKTSSYITKKVADKLNSLCKKDRAEFEKYWDDIHPFIKYGAIKDKDFYEKIKNSILYKTIADDYVTISEFSDRKKESDDKNIYYISNSQQQAQYVKMFKEHNLEAIILDTNIDSVFISTLESYNHDLHFARIDSDISSALKESGEETKDDKKMQDTLEEIFRKSLDMKKLSVKTERLKSENVSAIMLLSESSRRMRDMSKMFNGSMGWPGMEEDETTLVLNTGNPLVKALADLKGKKDREEDVKLICWQLYDLAMMSHKPLDNDQMTRFIERTNKILERISA